MNKNQDQSKQIFGKFSTRNSNLVNCNKKA